MTTPLNSDVFVSLFPPEERKTVEALLLRPRHTPSESRLDRVLDSVPDDITMKVAPNTGKMSHTAHNAMLQGLHTDLLRLFQIYGELDQSLASHKLRSQSLTQELHSQIDELERRVRYMEQWARRGEGEGAPIEVRLDHESPISSIRDPELNRAVHEEDLLHYIATTGDLVLPIASEVNRIRPTGGGITAQLVWIRQDGGYPVEGKDGLRFALDGRRDTAWWARHISTAPVRDKVATGLEEGVSTTLDLIFESSGPLSELIISPFGPAGIEVISVACYAEEDDPLPIRPLWVGEVDGENSDPRPLRSPFSATRPFVIYGFGDSVKRVRIKIGQSHHRLRRISRKDLLDPESIPFEIPDEIQDWTEARNVAIPGKIESEPNQEVIVYEYLYGIRNIEAVTRTYRRRGLFISAPIETEKPLDQVSIEIDYDSLGTEEASTRFYVLAHGRSIPIAPKEVKNEANRWVDLYPVTFKGLGVADLPFPVDMSRTGEFVLYEQNQIVPQHHYSINQRQVAYAQYRPDLQYWVSYPIDPDEQTNGMTVDLTNLGIEPKERVILFPPDVNTDSSGGRVIELPKEPYIDINKIVDPGFHPNGSYRPVEVTLIGSFPDTDAKRIHMVNLSEMEDPWNPEHPYVLNATDYLTGVRRMLIPYSEDRKIYSFRQEGRKLIFADPLEGVTIEVKYRTLIDHIRIAAVMERGNTASLFQSPRLREILVRPRYVSFGI